MELPQTGPQSPRALPSWLPEREVVFLTLLVCGTYFTRLDALPIRGEESRRGFVAQEMRRSGDWIVPRFQRNPYFMSSRPPLQAWLIAACGWLRGGIDTVAVRLPSVAALLALTLLIYACSRTFLSRTGALAAAASYATMGSVLQLGRLGETDLLFTLFVAGSLLVWHVGYTCRWPAGATWSAAYALVALGVLTKGPQAPAYFAASIGLYLCWVRQPGYLVSRGHLLGLLVFVSIWGGWQVPYYLQMGLRGVRHIYLGDVAMYGQARTWSHLATHVLSYPVEILAGCLIPWSFLLLVYLRKDFRARLGTSADWVAFLICCIVATFPSVWLVADARTRFYMPLFPCFAVLCGIVVEKCVEADSTSRLRRFWTSFLVLMALLSGGSGSVVLAVSLTGRTSLATSWGSALAYCLFALSCSFTMLTVRGGNSRRQGSLAVGVMALFLGASFASVMTDTMLRLSIDKEAQMARLMERLPPGLRLYSFGAVDHAFGFYYDADIGHVHFPTPQTVYPPDFEYFCFCIKDFPEPETLPFSWELLGAVSCGRNWDQELETLVVVGRKVAASSHPTADDVVSDYHRLHGNPPRFRGLLADPTHLPGETRS